MLKHHNSIDLDVYTDAGRFYQVNKHYYPGVGTILNVTDSAEQQEFWSRGQSHAVNLDYSDKAKDRGKTFHGMIENYRNLERLSGKH